MPLVFSPLTEAVLDSAPKALFPKSAFAMLQLGDPPSVDREMLRIVGDVFGARGIVLRDASTSTAGKDFLERILGLIRATGFTVAIFSSETRPTAMANIALELGFAAMCGKPFLIVKSEQATAPSDLSRTDWIIFSIGDEAGFRSKLNQAIDEIERLVDYEEDLAEVALSARAIDCAVAFERVNKAFLISGERRFIDLAERILSRVEAAGDLVGVADFDRLRAEIATFVRQARKALGQGPSKTKRRAAGRSRRT